MLFVFWDASWGIRIRIRAFESNIFITLLVVNDTNLSLTLVGTGLRISIITIVDNFEFVLIKGPNWGQWCPWWRGRLLDIKAAIQWPLGVKRI